MELKLEPEQPPAVKRAIVETLQERTPHPGPWWQAGIDEALEASASQLSPHRS